MHGTWGVRLFLGEKYVYHIGKTEKQWVHVCNVPANLLKDAFRNLYRYCLLFLNLLEKKQNIKS